MTLASDDCFPPVIYTMPLYRNGCWVSEETRGTMGARIANCAVPSLSRLQPVLCTVIVIAAASSKAESSFWAAAAQHTQICKKCIKISSLMKTQAWGKFITH